MAICRGILNKHWLESFAAGCNDESCDKVRALKKYCLCLPFSKPPFQVVKERVAMIAREQGIEIGHEAV